MDDRELNRLLREWKAPDAPPHLRPAPRACGHGCAGWSPARFACPYRLRSPRCCWPRCGSASTRPGPMSTPETSGPRPSGELARYALTGPLEGFDAVLVEVNFPPGVSVPEHRHPGPSSGTSWTGRCGPPSITSRTRSCRRAARSSNRTAPFTRRSVPRTRMRPCAPWHSWWFPAAAR